MYRSNIWFKNSKRNDDITLHLKVQFIEWHSLSSSFPFEKNLSFLSFSIIILLFFSPWEIQQLYLELTDLWKTTEKPFVLSSLKNLSIHSFSSAYQGHVVGRGGGGGGAGAYPSYPSLSRPHRGRGSIYKKKHIEKHH